MAQVGIDFATPQKLAATLHETKKVLNNSAAGKASTERLAPGGKVDFDSMAYPAAEPLGDQGETGVVPM